MTDSKITPLFPNAPAAGVDLGVDELVADLRALADEFERGERKATGGHFIYRDHLTCTVSVRCGRITHHEAIGNVTIAQRLMLDHLLG